MREAAGEFPPGGHTLGLDEALALVGELGRHRGERVRERAHLARAPGLDPDVPVAGGHLARPFGQPFDRPRHARREQVAEQQAGQDPQARDGRARALDGPDERGEFATRRADDQHAQHGSITSDQGHPVDGLGAVRPADGVGPLPSPGADPRDQRLERARVGDGAGGVDQLARREARVEIPVEEHAHAGGHAERRQQLLIDTPPADRVQGHVAGPQRPLGKQSEHASVRCFLGVQHRRDPAPQPVSAVPEPGRPVRG